MTEAAKILRVSRPTLSSLLNAKADLSGDMALRFLAESVKRSFECEGSLFRWTGPVLLMLQPRPVDKVQPEVRRVMESRLQYDCEAGSRHLLLSIDATWWVIPMMVDPRLLANKIDGLVRAPGTGTTGTGTA